MNQNTMQNIRAVDRAEACKLLGRVGDAYTRAGAILYALGCYEQGDSIQAQRELFGHVLRELAAASDAAYQYDHAATAIDKRSPERFAELEGAIIELDSCLQLLKLANWPEAGKEEGEAVLRVMIERAESQAALLLRICSGEQGSRPLQLA